MTSTLVYYASVIKPIAVHLQNVDAVSEAVQQSAGEPLRVEDLGPLVDGQVGGGQDRPSLVPLAEDLEEELCAGLGEWDEAKLVDDQQLESGKSLLEVEQPSLIPGLDQLVDQRGGRGEADRQPPLPSGEPQAEGHMGLAGAANGDDVLTPGSPVHIRTSLYMPIGEPPVNTCARTGDRIGLPHTFDSLVKSLCRSN